MPVRCAKSVIKVAEGDRWVWYHAWPCQGELVLRRIPAPAETPLEKEREPRAAAEIDGDQFTFAEATELTKLPVDTFSVSQPEAWAHVVRRIERAQAAQVRLHQAIDQAIAREEPCESLGTFCNNAVNGLGNAWCVNREDNEGVLFSRNRGEGPEFQASVNEETLLNEEGLSYALFNGRLGPRNDRQIISYEAFLLRPKRTVKCDLVAYHSEESRLVAVEVKLNPFNNATEIKHGILQAIAYGKILQRCHNDHHGQLAEQVGICLNQWCGQEGGPQPIDKVAFALAAPRGYFVDSLHMLDPKWMNDVIAAAGVAFDGFWVLNKMMLNAYPADDGEGVVPTIEYEPEIAADVEKLVETCTTN